MLGNEARCTQEHGASLLKKNDNDPVVYCWVLGLHEYVFTVVRRGVLCTRVCL